MKKFLPVIIILVVAGFAVKYYMLQGNFKYAGTLEATKVDLSARLAASIESESVQEGDAIKKDQLLVVLTCEDFKIADRLANENYDRTAKLFRSGSASKETMDQDTNKKQDADTRLDWCMIKAPIDGKVLSRYHEPGEWVNPGTKILTVANIRQIWAYIYVPENLVAKLTMGEKLTGTLPELNNKEFQGHIVKINDEAEFTPKNVQTQAERERLVFGVKISFEESNADEVLKPGMTIEVQLPK